MAKDLLLEIGLEEVPARFIRGAVEQLRDKVGKWLDDAKIGHGELRMYATPRRIAVLVEQVAEKQEDLDEEVKGPSRKIAQDEQGEWSKAALGFARSQGVDPSQFYFRELNGVEYVYARKSSVGAETASLLSEQLASIIGAMSFPKNMRWADYDMKFVRPIRWIAALFGADMIDLTIAGVKSGRTTRGHRFLGSDTDIAEPAQYVEALRKQHVIADIEERKALVVGQIEALARDKGWNVPMKDDLLEEVLFLVETPTALFGSFSPEFLHIPQEVLITSMREHQRYFPVLDQAGQLLPYFVTVRNGNDASIDQVARGNEKVLRARLSDARFFYEEDQKLQIHDALAKLEKIVFHEELGTVGDKVRRIRAIADQLAAKLGVQGETLEHVRRAAAICKFDLVTQMVYEFPELQGIMGEDYARKAGEPEAVCKAIFEHYQPRFSGDATPASIVGAIVSIADKIDTITGCFSIGIVPTGSQDPYALRRQASGIVQMAIDNDLRLTLGELFDIAMDVHSTSGLLKRDADSMRKDFYDFFGLRVKNVLSEQVRYDVADAVMAAGIDRVGAVIRKARALQAFTESESNKAVLESFNRVNNLAAKAESAKFDPSGFEQDVEARLHAAWSALHDAYAAAMAEGREAEALAGLEALKQPITDYFESVMVMAEDPKLRANRLGLLASIAEDFRLFADFQKIVW